MKNNENKVELTKDLYNKMTNDKVSFIAQLKEERDSLIKTISEDKKTLKELKAEKKQIIKNIKVCKRAINKNSAEKFYLSEEEHVQQKFLNRIIKIFTKKEDKYINVDKFYTEEEISKKR